MRGYHLPPLTSVSCPDLHSGSDRSGGEGERNKGVDGVYTSVHTAPYRVLKRPPQDLGLVPSPPLPNKAKDLPGYVEMFTNSYCLRGESRNPYRYSEIERK